MARFTRKRACPSGSTQRPCSRTLQQSNARPTKTTEEQEIEGRQHLLQTERTRIHAEDFCMRELWSGSPPANATAQLPVVRTAAYRAVSRETSRQRTACRRTRAAWVGNRRTTAARRHDTTFGPGGPRLSAATGCTGSRPARGSRADSAGTDSSSRADKSSPAGRTRRACRTCVCPIHASGGASACRSDPTGSSDASRSGSPSSSSARTSAACGALSSGGDGHTSASCPTGARSGGTSACTSRVDCTDIGPADAANSRTCHCDTRTRRTPAGTDSARRTDRPADACRALRA